MIVMLKCSCRSQRRPGRRWDTPLSPTSTWSTWTATWRPSGRPGMSGSPVRRPIERQHESLHARLGQLHESLLGLLSWSPEVGTPSSRVWTWSERRHSNSWSKMIGARIVKQGIDTDLDSKMKKKSKLKAD